MVDFYIDLGRELKPLSHLPFWYDAQGWRSLRLLPPSRSVS